MMVRGGLTQLRNYGWRLPFFLAHHVGGRAAKVLTLLRCVRLRLFCYGDVGRAVYVGSGLRLTPRARIHIGEQVHIGRSCNFVIAEDLGVKLEIGPGAWISERCLIHANSSLKIGRDVLIGEGVSLRDTTHLYGDGSRSVKECGDRVGTICIEDGVWIGRGVLVLGRPEGTTLGKGCVIAANSVVTRNIPPGEIWGGVPAHFIKAIESRESL